MPDRFAIIIGGMKCGTTSLFAMLAGHPAIAACRQKEPEFFNRDEHWARGVDWYRSLWAWRDAEHAWALEASADYTKRHLYPDTAERMASIGADCRLIYLLRHPVERIESHYRFLVLRKGGAPPSATPDALLDDAIETCRYAHQLEAYAPHVPRERILLASFDELARDPASLLVRICGFLEIDPTHRFRTGTPYNQGRVDHPIYTALCKVPLAVALVTRLMPAERRQAIRNRMSRAGDEPMTLTPRQRAIVAESLRDDLRVLRDDYGFDTSGWSLDG